MRFSLGVLIGLVLGLAVMASAQYMYPGLYDGKALTDNPGGAAWYSYGVIDALIARHHHIYVYGAGGAGAKHLDKAYECMWTTRIWRSEDFQRRLRALWLEEPHRNGALRMIDHACRLAGK